MFRAGPEGAAARCSTRGCTTPRTAGYPRSSRWRRRSGAGATTSWRRWAWGSATAAWSRPQRQGQGGGQDGLRIPQRGQPHIPAHAQVLRHQAGPAGAVGGMRPLSTNTNEGSMSRFAWKSGRRPAGAARNQTCQDGRPPESWPRAAETLISLIFRRYRRICRERPRLSMPATNMACRCCRMPRCRGFV